MLNLNQLAQFLSVARTENLTLAADELNVSTAALSKSLANLERQIGARLFDRVGRGLQLTGLGTALVGQASELLGHADAVSATITRSAEGSMGHVRVGTGPAALSGLVTDLVKFSVTTYPGIRLEIESGRTKELLLGLRQHRYDFLVTDGGDAHASTELNQYLIARLPPEPLVLVCSRTHPLASRLTVRLSETLDYPWVTPHAPVLMRNRIAHQLQAEKAPARAFERLAVIPDVRIEDLNACMQIAAGSQCLAATLKSTTTSNWFHPSLTVVPTNLSLWTNIAVIRLTSRTPTPSAARLMAALSEPNGQTAVEAGQPAIR